jgi:hypothetical protein
VIGVPFPVLLGVIPIVSWVALTEIKKGALIGLLGTRAARMYVISETGDHP